MVFTESELKKKTVEQLKVIAKEHDIDLPDIVFKIDIIAAILEDQDAAGEEEEEPEEEEEEEEAEEEIKPVPKVEVPKPAPKVENKTGDKPKEDPKKRHAYWV
jgi:hypothetical protein